MWRFFGCALAWQVSEGGAFPRGSETVGDATKRSPTAAGQQYTIPPQVSKAKAREESALQSLGGVLPLRLPELFAFSDFSSDLE